MNLLEQPLQCSNYQAYMMGVVPSAAKVGDVIVQFWNCDAAIVMRPIDLRIPAVSVTRSPTSSFVLVGRADVAGALERQGTPGCDTRAGQGLFGSLTVGPDIGSQATGPVYVDLDFRTLQSITASISTSGRS